MRSRSPRCSRAVVAGVLVLLIAVTLILLKLSFLLLLIVGPFFLLIGTHPGFGRVVALRWVEMLIGVLLKQAAIALVLSVLLYCYALIMGTSDCRAAVGAEDPDDRAGHGGGVHLPQAVPAPVLRRRLRRDRLARSGQRPTWPGPGPSARANTLAAATVAAPPFAAYRAGRWARRNPGQAAAWPWRRPPGARAAVAAGLQPGDADRRSGRRRHGSRTGGRRYRRRRYRRGRRPDAARPRAVPGAGADTVGGCAGSAAIEPARQGRQPVFCGCTGCRRPQNAALRLAAHAQSPGPVPGVWPGGRSGTAVRPAALRPASQTSPRPGTGGSPGRPAAARPSPAARQASRGPAAVGHGGRTLPGHQPPSRQAARSRQPQASPPARLRRIRRNPHRPGGSGTGADDRWPVPSLRPARRRNGKAAARPQPGLRAARLRPGTALTVRLVARRSGGRVSAVWFWVASLRLAWPGSPGPRPRGTRLTGRFRSGFARCAGSNRDGIEPGFAANRFRRTRLRAGGRSAPT